MNRGHLEERRPGVWRFRAPAPKDIFGRQRQHSRTFEAKSRRDAERVAARLLVEWDEGDGQATALVGTVREVVDAYEVERARHDSPSTIYRRRSILAAIRADLGVMRVREFTARHADRWYADLERRGLSARTVRQYHATLRAAFALAEDYELVVSNPLRRAHPPSVRPVELPMPSVDEVRRVLAVASRSARMGVLLAVVTGARCGQVVGLRWGDLDGRELVKVPGSQVVVRPGGKTGRTPDVILPEWMVGELERHRAQGVEWAAREGRRWCADGPILSNQRADPSGATPFAPAWLTQEWDRLCLRAGVGPFRLHSLRHLHGSLLQDAGLSLAAVARRQGQSIEVLARNYLHRVDEADVRAAAVLGDRLAPLLGP